MGALGVPRHRSGRLAVGIGAAVIAAILLGAGTPDRAEAAPCPTPTYGLSAGEFSVEGGFACSDLSQEFRVYCSGGQIYFDYTVSGNPQGVTNTGFACSTPTHLTATGGLGGDRLDLTGVSAATGFTGISQPNKLNGSAGNDLLIGSALPDNAIGSTGSDTLLLRDGVPDTADCGDGYDTVQADRAGVDSLIGCEFSDVLPTPAKSKCKKGKKRGRAGAASAKSAKKKCRKPKR